MTMKICPYCFEVIPEERTCKCVLYPEKQKPVYYSEMTSVSVGRQIVEIEEPRKKYRFRL